MLLALRGRAGCVRGTVMWLGLGAVLLLHVLCVRAIDPQLLRKATHHPVSRGAPLHPAGGALRRSAATGQRRPWGFRLAPPKPRNRETTTTPPLRTVETADLTQPGWTSPAGAEPPLPTLLESIKRIVDVNHGLVADDLTARSLRWRSCAVVGNSGRLLSEQHGRTIDLHDAVWRLNIAPTRGFERLVGSRTDVQLMNALELIDCHKREERRRTEEEQEAAGGGEDGGGAWDCLPNGPRVVVVARPADGVVERHWQARWKYAFLHSRRAHGSRTSWVALPTGVERQCQAAIGAYVRRRVRDRVDGAHKMRVGVRTTPSTGMVAVTAALALCDKVTMYGFGKMEGVQHHYHDTVHTVEYSKHDYAAEMMMYRQLVEGIPVPFLSNGTLQTLGSLQYVQ